MQITEMTCDGKIELVKPSKCRSTPYAVSAYDSEWVYWVGCLGGIAAGAILGGMGGAGKGATVGLFWAWLPLVGGAAITTGLIVGAIAGGFGGWVGAC